MRYVLQVQKIGSDTYELWVNSARGRRAAQTSNWLAGAKLPAQTGYRGLSAARSRGLIALAPTTPPPEDKLPWIPHRTDAIPREHGLCCGQVRITCIRCALS